MGTRRAIAESSLKVSRVCREFAKSLPNISRAYREFVGSSPKAIGNLLGVCRELVEGDRELARYVPEVH
ncbi:hypothetical protein GW17_00040250 [Ensete ventricosum]|uniref:Uncharacterized protein n=1 Tax=Ensete ventricosum TaxID=4639 RepID=A0A444DFW8_ENSVE|nr:hypothetical protein GW17_00040250 [Ensete ventricosum]RZR74281.1 hypothetical protein BHM03_00034708 [Ensete ventricosum]